MSDMAAAPVDALIGGKWVAGSGGTFEVRSPHSREVVNVVARCDPSDVDQAVAAARAAQPAWAALPSSNARRFCAAFTSSSWNAPSRSRRCLRRRSARRLPILGRRSTSTRHLHTTRRPRRFFGTGDCRLPSTQEQTTNKRLVLGHRPLGVVGVITPYNFPTDISSIALAHIIAAGNTAVWKPSEYAPVSCAMVAQLFEEAGLPPGVVNVVQGVGDVGAAIVSHDDVDGIFFTGSTKTGEQIARAAALKPHLLELGGDGPFIILGDADVDAAVDGAMNGCFYYSGQVCTSAERLLVHEDVYDEFVAKLTAKAAELRIGDPADEATQMGPLCNDATLKRVVEHVADARERGAEIVQYGPEKELYFPATILTGVTEEMLIMQEETFGPVAPIMKISSAEQAVEIANRSELGLIASLWTRDLATAWRVGEALPHGSVNINETSNYWDQLAPFGGTGKSGVGRELSQWFLESFTERKLLVFDLGDSEVKYNRRAEGGW